MLSFCTVITRDYLQQAMVLFRSIAEHHPESSLYGLVVDGDPSEEHDSGLPFQPVFLEDLGMKNMEHMVIYYSAFELCNAVRPSLLKHLMLHYDVQKIIYLDADIYVTGAFQEASSLMDTCLFSLTPHITKPLPLDGQQPDDLQLLQVGLYNSGFWMFRKHERSLMMLDWLISRFERYCFDDLAARMFCDQKLLPMLVQLFHDDFKSLDAPQYNVAHWNLFQRDIVYRENQYWIDDKPVVFFHLSGFRPEQPHLLTHHLHRMPAALLDTLQPVLLKYSALLQSDTARGVEALGYKYSHDPDTGLALTHSRRRYYFEHGTLEGVMRIERRQAFRRTVKKWVRRVLPI